MNGDKLPANTPQVFALSRLSRLALFVKKQSQVQLLSEDRSEGVKCLCCNRRNEEDGEEVKPEDHACAQLHLIVT